MFEACLVESRGHLVTRSRRWITAASVGVQCLVAAAIVALPLMHPEALSYRTMTPAVVVPPVPKPPVVVVARQPAAASVSASLAAPFERVETHVATLRTLRPLEEPAPPTSEIGISRLPGMGSASAGIGDLLDAAAVGSGRHVVAASVPRQPLSLSSGVSAGLLLRPIQPVYPGIAIAAHVQGVVVVEATISKTGTIEHAHVLSGPAMLAAAALEAVRTARYRPYLLNGVATEVSTSVTVNFRLGGAL